MRAKDPSKCAFQNKNKEETNTDKISTSIIQETKKLITTSELKRT